MLGALVELAGLLRRARRGTGILVGADGGARSCCSSWWPCLGGCQSSQARAAPAMAVRAVRACAARVVKSGGSMGEIL